MEARELEEGLVVDMRFEVALDDGPRLSSSSDSLSSFTWVVRARDDRVGLELDALDDGARRGGIDFELIQMPTKHNTTLIFDSLVDMSDEDATLKCQ